MPGESDLAYIKSMERIAAEYADRRGSRCRASGIGGAPDDHPVTHVLISTSSVGYDVVPVCRWHAAALTRNAYGVWPLPKVSTH